MRREKTFRHLLLLLPVLYTLLSRAPFYRTDFFNVDEAIIGTVGRGILEGKEPYNDLWDHKSPLPYYFCALVFGLAGRVSLEDARWALHFFFLIPTLIMVYLIGCEAGGYRSGFAASLILALYLSVGFPMDMMAVNSELFMILFDAISMVLLILYSRGKGRALLFLSAFMAGLSFLSKQNGAVLLPLLFYAMVKRERGKGAKVCITISLSILATFSLPLFLFLLPCLLSGRWEGPLFLILTYNFSHHLPASSLSEALSNLIFFSVTTGTLYIFPVTLSLFHIFRFPARGKGELDTLLQIYLLLSFAGFLSGRRFFGHHFIQLLPPLSILSGIMVLKLIDFTKRGFQGPGFRKWLALLPPLLFLLSILVPLYRSLDILVKMDRVGIHYSYYPLEREDRGSCQKRLFSSLKGLEDGREGGIFAWGFLPEAYILSKRSPSSPFIYLNFVTGHTAFSKDTMDGETDLRVRAVEGSLPLLVKSLKRAPPLYFIDTSPADYFFYGKEPLYKYGDLSEFVTERYTLKEDVCGVKIYERGAGR